MFQKTSHRKPFVTRFIAAMCVLFVAEIATAQDAESFISEFVNANKTWLQPDWNCRQELVYNYTQENGHLQQVTFDRQGNCLVVYESPTVFPDNEKSVAAAKTHTKPFNLFLAKKDSYLYGDSQSAFLMPTTVSRSTQIFWGESGRVNLATGWHWQSATTFLGLFPNEFDASLAVGEDDKEILLTLKPKSPDATLEMGTMLSSFSSYAYLPNRRYERCEVLIDKATNRPVEEHYYRQDEKEPFATVRYSGWLDLADGQAPGNIEAEQTMTEKMSFSVTAFFRNDNGHWLAEKVESQFHETGKPNIGSTGTITVVNDTEEIEKRLQKITDILKKVTDTQKFLDTISTYPVGREKTVPFLLDSPVTVGLIGKKELYSWDSQDKNEPKPWQNKIGIVQYRAKESDGKFIIDADVFSTNFKTEYAITLLCRLLDANGNTLVQIEKDDTVRAENIPVTKTLSFEFDKMGSPSINAVQFDFRIGRLVASNFIGRWAYHVDELGNNRNVVPLFTNLRDWGPEQALGEPSYFDEGGDYRAAWASRKPNDGIQWLELHYPRTVSATGVNVFETYNPGALVRVSAFDTDGKESTVWEGSDPAKITDGMGTARVEFAQPVNTQRIRLYLDTDKVDGWNEIDAVALLSGEDEYWAVNADASSSYASEPKPKSFLFAYDGPQTELKYDKGFNEGMRSLGGMRQVIEMKRPKEVPYLNAVRVLASHYGSQSREKIKMLLLDSDGNILYELTPESPIRQFGMRWYLFHVPSVKVPETFRIAFQFNSERYSGVYVGTRICDVGETSRSFEQEINSGDLSPLKQGDSHADWLIRAYLSESPMPKE